MGGKSHQIKPVTLKEAIRLARSPRRFKNSELTMRTMGGMMAVKGKKCSYPRGGLTSHKGQDGKGALPHESVRPQKRGPKLGWHGKSEGSGGGKEPP